MTRRRQHSKGRKRPSSWHRGKATGRKARRILDDLPDVGSGADPTAGQITPITSRARRRRMGDSL